MNYPKNRYTGVKPWMNKEWLYHQYVELDKSSKEIANEYGCVQNTIQCWLSKHKIKKNITSHKMTYTKQYQNSKYLYNEHITKKRTISDIAKENNVSFDTIKYFMNKYNIEAWSSNKPIELIDSDKKVIFELYFDNKMSAYAISKLFGCSHRTIIDMIRSYGKETRTMQESQFAYNEKEIDDRFNDAEWLNKKFWDDQLTSNEIGQILGINGSTVLRQMKRLGLSTNIKSENRFNIASIQEYVPSSINSLESILRDYFRINIRPSILYRDNHECQLCKAKKNLQTHHIIHFDDIINEILSENTDLSIGNKDDLIKLYLIIRKDPRFVSKENVITLCESCHSKAHSKEFKEIISSQVNDWKQSLKGSTTIER